MTPAVKGLRQFLDLEQQQAWLDGEPLADGARPEQSLEQRFKYAARYEKLLRRPQADNVLDLLRTYAATALPIPRQTERFYWSVSCLPGSPDKPLVRVNASWMELFTLLPDHSSPLVGEEQGGGPAASAATENRLRARFILHLADFTRDNSVMPEQLDQALLEQSVARPQDVTHHFWGKADILVVKVRGAASIRAFLAHPHALRAIRRFNLTHLNRGRNAYQASHSYSLADAMLGD